MILLDFERPEMRRNTAVEKKSQMTEIPLPNNMAKKASSIRIFEIPPRSPDLNVCDYALWKKVTRNMRLQEKKFSKGKRETRVEYVGRLRRTAKRLSPAFVNKAIGSMRKRCQRLYAAKGHHFEEGGL